MCSFAPVWCESQPNRVSLWDRLHHIHPSEMAGQRLVLEERWRSAWQETGSSWPAGRSVCCCCFPCARMMKARVAGASRLLVQHEATWLIYLAAAASAADPSRPEPELESIWDILSILDARAAAAAELHEKKKKAPNVMLNRPENWTTAPVFFFFPNSFHLLLER